jgi:prepilin-type N-terminal cleavage/methylation domain-containing protein
MSITNRMKFRRLHSASRSGFTLVELLVVIGIIAILASVVAVAAGAAINQAKRTRAAALATQLQTAVSSYYTEYGVYPVPAGTTTDILFQTAPQWQPLTVALNGGVDPGNPIGGQVAGNGISNTRQIAYISLNHSDLDTTVTPAAPKTPFKDNKGKPQYFYMAVDSDYSNIIGDTGGNTTPPDFASAKASDTALPGGKAISGSVAIWANCDPTTNGTKTHPNLWIHTY